jgi:hypothetical protein
MSSSCGCHLGLKAAEGELSKAAGMACAGIVWRVLLNCLVKAGCGCMARSISAVVTAVYPDIWECVLEQPGCAAADKLL